MDSFTDPEEYERELRQILGDQGFSDLQALHTPPAQRWKTHEVQHFKGGNYLILGLVRNASDENATLIYTDEKSGQERLARCEWWVCYKSLDNPGRVPFIRPMGEFMQILYGGKARFADKDGNPAVPHCPEYEAWLGSHPAGRFCEIDR